MIDGRHYKKINKSIDTIKKAKLKGREEGTQEKEEGRGRSQKEERRRREKRGQGQQEKKRRKNEERRPTLRLLPAETRLTVYRRFNIFIPESASFKMSFVYVSLFFLSMSSRC